MDYDQQQEDEHVTPVKRGAKQGLLLRWLGLNLIRLVGVIGICWAIGVQFIVLSQDLKGTKNSISNNSTMLSSHTTSTSASDPSSSYTTSFDLADSLLVATATSNSATDTAGLVMEITPTASPTKKKRLIEDNSVWRRDYNAIDKRSNDSDGTASGDLMYYDGTTVPIQTGGLAFAILGETSQVVLLVVLLLGQVGLPEGPLLRLLPSLSMSSSTTVLGLGQIYVGISMQRHYYEKAALLLPSYFLLIIGLINAVMGGIISALQWQDVRKGQVYVFSRAQRFHGVQRIPFWTPLPNALFRAQTSTMTSTPLRRDSEATLNEKLEMAQRNKAEAGQNSYPTFTGASMNDKESQIPSYDENGNYVPQPKSKLAYVTEEDEEEEEEEKLMLSQPPARKASAGAIGTKRLASTASSTRIPAPPISPSLSAIPPKLQQLMQAATGINADLPPPPRINLIPNTGSTVASNGRSVKFPRPNTAFSTSSVGSVNSGRTDRSTLLHDAVSALPSPPIREETPARARPKSHLMHKPMDGSKLMPPRLAGTGVRRAPEGPSDQAIANAQNNSRQVQQARGIARPSSIGFDPAGVMITAPISSEPQRRTWVGPPSDARTPQDRRLATRSVRFDTRQGSTDSTASSDTALTGISDFLPSQAPTSSSMPQCKRLSRVARSPRMSHMPIPPRPPPPAVAPPTIVSSTPRMIRNDSDTSAYSGISRSPGSNPFLSNSETSRPGLERSSSSKQPLLQPTKTERTPHRHTRMPVNSSSSTSDRVRTVYLDAQEAPLSQDSGRSKVSPAWLTVELTSGRSSPGTTSQTFSDDSSQKRRSHLVV